jgi:membrane protein DedA with SNARE-associated domain
MPFARFSLLTLLGCIPWVTGLALAGRAVGENWEDLRTQLHYVDYALILGVLAGIAYLVLRQRRARARRAAALTTEARPR